MTVLRHARTVLRNLRWSLREPTGEVEYDRHCERHRGRHPHTPAPTRREYEVLRPGTARPTPRAAAADTLLPVKSGQETPGGVP